jgi:hypothetical protein
MTQELKEGESLLQAIAETTHIIKGRWVLLLSHLMLITMAGKHLMM